MREGGAQSLGEVKVLDRWSEESTLFQDRKTFWRGDVWDYRAASASELDSVSFPPLPLNKGIRLTSRAPFPPPCLPLPGILF